MRAILTFFAAAALACAAAPVRADQLQPAPAMSSAALSGPAAEAARVVDAFHAALGRGDTAGALAMLAEDALIFEEGGAERSKAEYASHHLAADAAFSQAVSNTRTRRTGRAEGALAWIASEGRARGEFRGRAVDRVSTETMVLRRERGRWVIVHVHWSSKASGG